MESNSLANRIQCSEAAATLLMEQAPGMSLRKRGKIAVKGKGNMVTYWVGLDLLQEEADGSVSRSYNERPTVSFAPEEPIKPGKAPLPEQAPKKETKRYTKVSGSV